MNKVLVIGVDHHNTLAAIRCFGRKNVEMEILVHENIEQLKKVKISHSKYAKNIYIVKNDEKSIFNWLIMHKEDEKILIVPCSDLAEYTIDKHYKDLSNFYIIPGFKNNNGKICKMMDKYEQKKWADKNKIPMAKSWSVKRKNNSFKIPDDIVYPCIIKPQISALGMKSDIVKANSENELKKILDEKINNGYDEIFIQEFLNKKFEILAQGCIVDESPNFFGGVTKKLMVRMPPGGGSTVLGQYISGKKIVDKEDYTILNFWCVKMIYI